MLWTVGLRQAISPPERPRWNWHHGQNGFKLDQENDWRTHKQSIGKTGLNGVWKNGGFSDWHGVRPIYRLPAGEWGHHSLDQPNEKAYLQSLALEQ